MVFAKGSAVLIWRLREPRLNCAGNPSMQVPWNAGDIFDGNGGVMPKRKGHLTSRSFERGPGLGMRQRFALIEALLSIFSEAGEGSIFFHLQRFFEEVSDFQ